VIVIIYKLSAEKTDLREYRVVMASTAAHQISPSKRPRLVGAPMITSVEIAKTLSREETRDQFAQASDLTAKVIVQGKPGETCSGKATAIFEIAPDGSEKPRRETVRKDVTLTFDAAGQASFDLSASFDPPLMCSTFKVTVSGGCPQLVSFTARDFLACGI
jgi:hypothetical protein